VADHLLARFHDWWTRKIVMPRWAIALDLFYRLFLLGGAALVIVLWWQAATRDEEADRNARIQSCASVYAATYSAWDATAGRLFGELIASSVDGTDPDPDQVEDYATATANADELARRRIGLGIYAAASVERGNDFSCPPLPERLMVTPIEP
jgi:hypothetical protein